MRWWRWVCCWSAGRSHPPSASVPAGRWRPASELQGSRDTEGEEFRNKCWHDHLRINYQVTSLKSSGDTNTRREVTVIVTALSNPRVRSFYMWWWSSGFDLVSNKLCVEVTCACKSTCKLQSPDQQSVLHLHSNNDNLNVHFCSQRLKWKLYVYSGLTLKWFLTQVEFIFSSTDAI